MSEPILTWENIAPENVDSVSLNDRMFRNGVWVRPVLRDLTPGQLLIATEEVFRVRSYRGAVTSFVLRAGTCAQYVRKTHSVVHGTHILIVLLDELSLLAFALKDIATYKDEDLVRTYALHWGIL